MKANSAQLGQRRASSHRQHRLLLNPSLHAALLLVLASQVTAQNVGGDPLYGAGSLDGGFSPDPFVIDVQAGGNDEADDNGESCTGYIAESQPDYRLTYSPTDYPLGFFVSADVDTTLIINAPNGSWYCNDDSNSLDSSNPGVLFSKPQSGQYDVWIGTYSSDDSGADARLVITEQDDDQWLTMDIGTGSPTADEEEFDQLVAELSDLLGEDGTGALSNTGTLEDGDATLPGYGFADNFTFTAESGQQAIIDLRSDDFDTYLVVETPSGERLTNDDYDGSTERSLLSLPLSESGTYSVTVSSFMADETGDYEMSVNVDGSGNTDSTTGARTESGALVAGDETLDSGEYVDVYEIEGRPGQTLTLDLRSDNFDTFLILQSPTGERVENDDTDTTSRSFIESDLSEVGTYRVMVTSYGTRVGGEYELAMNQETASETSVERDVAALSIGETASGDLESDDLLNDDGMYEDTYAFQGSAGDTVRLDLSSQDFDTYLRLITPSGESIDNDDFEGDVNLSAIELTLQESGRYRVVVTSYSAGSMGDYELSASPQSSRVIVENTSGGQIYGIFAGISDYPGTDSDLSYTDQDATRARDALINGAGMSPDNAITLLNDQATVGNLRAAIDRFAAQIDPEDTFVLFYSGHGSRSDRSGGPDNADPDGLDESIVLYDGEVLDDELNGLFSNVAAGTTLLVLDSCFSGGFAKDFISRPGRMGLFSSEEDVTSQVAAKFRAGGYLSVFFEEALEGYADFDENGELTALELSEYLHNRFRVDVKSASVDQYVSTGGPQSGYQHLVVDRGGVGPYNILFNHR
ncbi:MAG: pre-peptidase C-terminal domain-containing protein [Pseudomonadota bacterium]